MIMSSILNLVLPSWVEHRLDNPDVTIQVGTVEVDFRTRKVTLPNGFQTDIDNFVYVAGCILIAEEAYEHNRSKTMCNALVKNVRNAND